MKKYLLFLLSLTLLLSCSETTEEVKLYNLEKVYYNAEKLQKTLFIRPQSITKEDYEKLISAYEKVIEQFPSSQKAAVFTPQIKRSSNLAISSGRKIAEFYLYLGKIEEAKNELAELLSHYPQNQEQLGLVVLHLAQLNERLGNQKEADTNYEKLYDIKNYPPYNEKGTPDLDLLQVPIHLLTLSAKDENLKMERFQKAKEYYVNLIALNKSPELNFAATVTLAQSYKLADQWEQVVNTLYQAKDSTGKLPNQVLLEIGDIYLQNPKMKDENKALSIYQDIITNFPKSVQADLAQLRLGAYYGEKGENQKAEKILSALAKNSGFSQIVSRAQFLFAALLEKEDNWEKALAEYQWLITNQPNSDEALEASLHLVQHYQKEKNANLEERYLEKAEKHYQAVMEKNQPQAFKARHYLASLYLVAEEWDKSLVVLQNIEKDATPSGRVESLILQADIYETKKNDHKKAKETYQKLLSLIAGTALADSIKAKVAKL